MHSVFSPKDNSGRRSGIDRRNVFYTVHVPEQRSGKDRRSSTDRRARLHSHRLKETA